MTSDAYPDMVPGSAEYQKKKKATQKGASNGLNWFVGLDRCSCAL